MTLITLLAMLAQGLLTCMLVQGLRFMLAHGLRDPPRSEAQVRASLGCFGLAEAPYVALGT